MTVGFNLDDLEASDEAARPYMMHEDTRLPAMRLPIRTTAAGAINTSVADLAKLDAGRIWVKVSSRASVCCRRR